MTNRASITLPKYTCLLASDRTFFIAYLVGGHSLSFHISALISFWRFFFIVVFIALDKYAIRKNRFMNRNRSTEIWNPAKIKLDRAFALCFRVCRHSLLSVWFLHMVSFFFFFLRYPTGGFVCVCQIVAFFYFISSTITFHSGARASIRKSNIYRGTHCKHCWKWNECIEGRWIVCNAIPNNFIEASNKWTVFCGR